MEHGKKQSGGLFRRLFGMDLQTEETKTTLDTSETVQGESSTQEMKVASWDELVDKIAPAKFNVDSLLQPDKEVNRTDMPGADEQESTLATADTEAQTGNYVTASQPLTNAQVVWLLQQAEDDWAKGEMDKSEKLLEVAYALEHHPDVLLAMAKHAHLASKYEKAADYCLDALELDPDSKKGLDMLVILDNIPIDQSRLSAVQPEQAGNCVRLAKVCLERGYDSVAQDKFDRALAMGLNQDDIRFELGMLQERSGNVQLAIEHYRRDLTLGGSVKTALRLFDIYVLKERYEDAQKLADRYLNVLSDDAIVSRLAKLGFLQGRTLFESGQLETAVEYLTQAVARGSLDAREWLLRALLDLARREENDLAQTQLYYEKALAVSGFSKEVTEELVETYIKQGNYLSALDYLKQLDDMEPDNTQVLRKLADCYQSIGDGTQAAELWERLLRLEPGDKSIREQLVNYYREQARFEDAINHLKELYGEEPEVYETSLQSLHWEQIRFMFEQGQLEEAWMLCCREISHKPSPDMQGIAMKILFERLDKLSVENNVFQAIQEIEQARVLGLNDLDLALREARLYEQEGNDQIALKIYSSVVAKVPEVWDKIKELFLKAATREYLAGNMTEAIKLLEDAHTRLPQNDEVNRALGVLYLETGQFALAAALAQNSMQEDEIQVTTDHLNVLRPHGYRRVRLG